MAMTPSPTPAEITALRALCGLTQGEMARLLHTNDRTWRRWELGERRMNLALWELLRLKLGLTPL